MKITVSQCAGGGHTHLHIEDGKETRTVTTNTADLLAAPEEGIIETVKAVIAEADAKTYQEAKAAIEAKYSTVEAKP